MPDPTPESVAVDDLRFVARNLRDQGATAAAERVDALADDIATAHVATAGGEDQACIDADVDATDAASVDARLPEPARAPALEGPTALLTARIRPPVDAEAAVEVLDKVLSGAGVEHRVLDVDSTTGTVEIEAAVDAPPAEGCVLIAGSFILISLALAVFHSQWWLIWTAFIGVNLIQSAFTKWCLMSDILAKFGVQKTCDR